MHGLFSLEGYTAVVTGGSRGLGLVMAQALADAGAAVVVTSRKLDDAQAAVRKLDLEDSRAAAVALDVSDRQSVRSAIDTALDKFGKVDILLNNAGINIRRPSLEVDDSADWDPVINTNLKGCLLCAQAVAPGMIERGYGRIINLGSIMSAVSLPGRAAYASSKHGLLGLTRTLALEWAKHGVTVNCLCPGPFATEMNQPILNDPARNQEFVSKIPIGRWGDPKELAGAVLFLASPASGFVTGTALYVDGGWTTQ